MPSDTMPPGVIAEMVSTLSTSFWLAVKRIVSRFESTGPLKPALRFRCMYSGLLSANAFRAFRWWFWKVKFRLP